MDSSESIDCSGPTSSYHKYTKHTTRKGSHDGIPARRKKNTTQFIKRAKSSASTVYQEDRPLPEGRVVSPGADLRRDRSKLKSSSESDMNNDNVEEGDVQVRPSSEEEPEENKMLRKKSLMDGGE